MHETYRYLADSIVEERLREAAAWRTAGLVRRPGMLSRLAAAAKRITDRLFAQVAPAATSKPETAPCP